MIKTQKTHVSNKYEAVNITQLSQEKNHKSGEGPPEYMVAF